MKQVFVKGCVVGNLGKKIRHSILCDCTPVDVIYVVSVQFLLFFAFEECGFILFPVGRYY